MRAENNTSKVLQEHTQKIYELYQNKSNSFQKTLRLLLSFALLFLFIILIPYVSIKILNDKMGDRQKLLQEEIQRRQTIIDIYKSVQLAINNLHSQLQNGAMSLRQYILSISQSDLLSQIPGQPNLAIQQLPPAQPPIRPPEVSTDQIWSIAQIQDEVQRRFDEYQRILREDVLKPLQSLNNDSIVVINLNPITAGLDTLQLAFSNELAQNPRFWETFHGKGQFYGKLDGDVYRFWQIHGSKIDKQSDLLNNEIIKLQQTKNELDNQLVELEKQEKEIGNRLNQIEFPFGKLPIGLNESIAVFPILLAIGFVVLAVSLRDTIRLRKSYHQLYQRTDPEKTILTNEQIMLIAPLWIDPLNSNKKNLIPLIILSIPVLIFLLSCMMIFYSWTIPGFLRFDEQWNWWLYGSMYLFSLLIFFYSYWQISKELNGY